ncbi:unnamed protein product, partial [Meganyctiphanes norvegica]
MVSITKPWYMALKLHRVPSVLLEAQLQQRRILSLFSTGYRISELHACNFQGVYRDYTEPLPMPVFPTSSHIASLPNNHGKIRIWDTVNPEHILKAEYQPLGGCIRDIAWSHDSQRIVVAGDGNEKYAHAFMMDSGASVKGDFSGHSKCINSVDWKGTRPFRIITGSEDNSSAFYEGPPFVFKCTKQDHTKYVQSVRYAPDGTKYATGGFDGKIFVYEGKDGSLIKELGSPAHKGGIYAVSWSPDSKQLLSASGDKSCKVWDVETGNMAADFVMGKEIEDQQVSCIWAGKHLISVGLNGFLNYLDPANPGKPSKVIKGHNKPITRAALTADKCQLYSTAVDGTVIVWDIKTGSNDRISGKGHGNQVTGLAIHDKTVYTCGIDDSVKLIDSVEGAYNGKSISLGTQPRHMVSTEDGVIVVTLKEIVVISGDQKTVGFPVDYEPMSVAVLKAGSSTEVAVGGADNKVHIYNFNGETFTEKKVLDHGGGVTDVSYSPDARYLVACDTYRKVIVYTLPDYAKFNKVEWGFHNARINSVAWSPDCSMVASGSLDTMIIIWSMKEHSKHIIIKKSHPQSQVTALSWLDDGKLISTGHDGLVKTWSVKF